MEQVDFLQAIAKMRAGMGVETPELEKIVIGRGGRPGIRSVLQDYINANADKFNVEDPAGAAAFQLLEESVKLAEGSLGASHDEAKKIYAKLRFIRELAKKTQGEQSAIANQLDSVIAPIEEQLKKRTSFSEFIKEKVQDFRKTLPERLVSKIPVVGGLLGQFMRQKRESKEELERFSGEIQESISRKGRRGADLFLPGAKRNQPRIVGGTRASDIPGLLGGESALQKREREFETRGPFAFPIRTFQAIQKDVESIKKAVNIIAKRRTGAGGGGGGGMLDMLGDRLGRRFFGRRSRLGRLFRRAKIGSKLGFRKMKNVIGRKWKAGKNLVGRGWQAGKDMVGRGLRAAGNLGSRAMGAFKNTSLFRGSSAIGKSVSSVGRGALDIAKSAGTRALNVGKSVGGKAVGWMSKALGSVSGAVSGLNPMKALSGAIRSAGPKVGKALLSAPGVASLLETAVRSINIAGIKSDPSLSVDQKKEQIGKQITGLFGGILGSIGGAALVGTLGSAIPVAGTAAGAFIGSGAGGWIGGWLGEQLGDILGGRGIYDLVSSIPGIASLIEVNSAEDQKEKAQTEAQVNKTAASAGAEGQTIGTEATGTISAPATPNTTVGKMMQQHNAEMIALEAERGAAVGTATKPSVSNNSVVQTKVSNTTNNFNDDLRIRNNEPTLKTMQMASHTW